MTDLAFQDFLPAALREKSRVHFSPHEVIQQAARYLTGGHGFHIADIGSGVGKFCVTAAAIYPNHHFTGIEIRSDLHDLANSILGKMKLKNVEFIHANVMEVSLHEFHHFYLFNPFHEHLEPENSLDNQFQFRVSTYQKYQAYLFRSLDRMPIGTRVAGFHLSDDSLPESYAVVNAWFDESLVGFEKIV